MFITAMMLIASIVVGGMIISNRLSVILHSAAAQASYYMFDWEEWQENYTSPTSDPVLRFLDCPRACYPPVSPYCNPYTECSRVGWYTLVIRSTADMAMQQAGIDHFVENQSWSYGGGSVLDFEHMRIWLVDDEKITLLKAEAPTGTYVSVYEGSSPGFTPVPPLYQDRFNGRNWVLKPYDRVWGVQEDDTSSHDEVEPPYVVAETDFDISGLGLGNLYSGGRASAIIAIRPGILERSAP